MEKSGGAPKHNSRNNWAQLGSLFTTILSITPTTLPTIRERILTAFTCLQKMRKEVLLRMEMQTATFRPRSCQRKVLFHHWSQSKSNLIVGCVSFQLNVLYYSDKSCSALTGIEMCCCNVWIWTSFKQQHHRRNVRLGLIFISTWMIQFHCDKCFSLNII